MSDFTAAFAAAFHLVLAFDPLLLGIVGLSLFVSLCAVSIAALLGLPLGAAIAVSPGFPGRSGLIVAMNAAMGLPPVVVGLVVYLLLSRAGPLGGLGLLFTPGAMIAAQTVLVLPIIAALSRQAVETLWEEHAEMLTSLGVGRWRAVPTLLWEGRFGLAVAVLAGLGRAIAEVGAIIIVGGNIAGYTRTMTTAIALETSKGNLALALGLGFVLIALAVALNVVVALLSAWGRLDPGFRP